jgi:hypothetical protein
VAFYKIGSVPFVQVCFENLGTHLQRKNLLKLFVF